MLMGPVALGGVLAYEHRFLGGVAHAITHANGTWLAAAVAAEVASMSAFSRLQRQTLKMAGVTVSRRTATLINYTSNAISSTIPIVGGAAGTANAWHQYRRRGVSAPAVAWALVASGVASALGYALLTASGALTSHQPGANGAGVGLLVVSAAVVGVLVASVRRPTVRQRAERMIAGVARSLRRLAPGLPLSEAALNPSVFLAHLGTYRLRPLSATIAVATGAANWAFNVACLALSIRAVGGHVPANDLIVMWAAAGTAGSLSITPGGVGIVEPVLAASLSLDGMGHTTALAATFTFRLVSFLAVVAAGWAIQLITTQRFLSPATEHAMHPTTAPIPLREKPNRSRQETTIMPDPPAAWDRDRPGPVAFVLAGGASHGAVQVGMLKALTDAGIVPDLLVGTSVGALNATAFAADPSPAGVAHLADSWSHVKRSAVFPIRPRAVLLGTIGTRNHVLSNHRLRALITETLPVDRLEATAIPVHVMTTDFSTGQPVMLSQGDAVTALLASSAIPGVFPQVEIGGRLLMDGGVAANIPIAQAQILGATVIYVLPTFGAGGPPRRRSALKVGLYGLDHLLAHPAATQIAAANDAVVVHWVPVPHTSDISPFRLSESGRLIDEAAMLTHSWLETAQADHISAA
jgi:NTE family protein